MSVFLWIVTAMLATSINAGFAVGEAVAGHALLAGVHAGVATLLYVVIQLAIKGGNY